LIYPCCSFGFSNQPESQGSILMLIDDPSLALIRREPFEVETKSSHNNGAGEPQIPGSKTNFEY